MALPGRQAAAARGKKNAALRWKAAPISRVDPALCFDFLRQRNRLINRAYSAFADNSLIFCVLSLNPADGLRHLAFYTASCVLAADRTIRQDVSENKCCWRFQAAPKSHAALRCFALIPKHAYFAARQTQKRDGLRWKFRAANFWQPADLAHAAR
jgi:hypothetical protein